MNRRDVTVLIVSYLAAVGVICLISWGAWWLVGK